MMGEITATPAISVGIENALAKLPPLCVDLDGTLVRTDTLYEQILVLLLGAPWLVFKLLRWVFLGKARFKLQVGCYTALDPTLLPYDERVLDFLQQEKDRGRTIILVTAADRTIAGVIADYLGLFDRVLASDGVLNLKGSAKAEVLNREFGRNFIYMGNDRADLAVWAVANSAVVANAPSSLVERVRQISNVELVFPPVAQLWPTLFQAVRPHQWSKNLLVFVPIITANAFLDARAWLAAAIAFLAFCAMASTVYILNDLSDLAADRQHPRKRQRPLATGALSVPAVLTLVVPLVACAAALSWSSGLFPIIILYAIFSLFNPAVCWRLCHRIHHIVMAFRFHDLLVSGPCRDEEGLRAHVHSRIGQPTVGSTRLSGRRFAFSPINGGSFEFLSGRTDGTLRAKLGGGDSLPVSCRPVGVRPPRLVLAMQTLAVHDARLHARRSNRLCSARLGVVADLGRGGTGYRACKISYFCVLRPVGNHLAVGYSEEQIF